MGGGSFLARCVMAIRAAVLSNTNNGVPDSTRACRFPRSSVAIGRCQFIEIAMPPAYSQLVELCRDATGTCMSAFTIHSALFAT